MENRKKDYTVATPEMVYQIIDEHFAADVSAMEVLLQSAAAINKPAVDVDEITADIKMNRAKLAENVNAYEDELVKMLDLATVLHERRNSEPSENLDRYINYLLEKNAVILPDVIEIIQLLKK